jgi:hypothetical protein
VRVNFIPRDGGNIFAGVVYFRFTNDSLQGDNFTSELQARGLPAPNSLKTNWEINPGFGGPIKRDKLWFFASARYTKDQGFIAGMFDNKNANKLGVWTYESRFEQARRRRQCSEGREVSAWRGKPLRKHKLGLTWQEQTDNPCPADVTAVQTAEAGTCRPQPVIRVAQTEWTAPVSNRLLLEAGFAFSRVQSNQLPPPGHNPAMIGVVEQSTGLRIGAFEQYRRQAVNSYNSRASISYITGVTP